MCVVFSLAGVAIYVSSSNNKHRLKSQARISDRVLETQSYGLRNTVCVIDLVLMSNIHV